MNRVPYSGRNRQDGQVPLLMALVATLAQAIAGAAVYLNRRRLQNAADASVMTGTRVATRNGINPEAFAAANDYALTRNSADTATFTSGDTALTVLAYENVPLSFARLLGRNTTTVCAKAVALRASNSQSTDSAPIAIMDFPYPFYTPYVIWNDDSERDSLTGYVSGSFQGWLNQECVYPAERGVSGSSTT